MSSCSFLLRWFLLFMFLSFLLLDSGAIPQHHPESFLDGSYQAQMTSSLLKANGGPAEDISFGSNDGQTLLGVKPAFLLEDEAQTARVWPRTMLDYMRQQLRFRGRTKKSSKKGSSWTFTL